MLVKWDKAVLEVHFTVKMSDIYGNKRGTVEIMGVRSLFSFHAVPQLRFPVGEKVLEVSETDQ